MHLKRFAFAALLCLSSFGLASAQTVFVVPTSSSNPTATIVNGASFTSSGTFSASPSTFAVLSAPDGSQYYVVSRDALVVLASGSSAVRERRNLNQASAAAVSPDGSKLYIGTADGLLILPTSALGQTPQAAGTTVATVGTSPTDIAFSIDSNTVFVVSTLSQKLTALNVTTNAVIASATITGGISPASVSVGPTGSVYVSTVNNIYEFDPVTLALKSTTQFRGNAGKLYFTPDGAYGFAVNQFVINGGSSVLLFDVNAKAVTAVPVGGGSLVDRLFYRGKNAQGQHVILAFSRATGRIYEITIPSLTVTDFAGTADVPTILGAYTSGEVTTPRYLYVNSSAGGYRIDLTGASARLSVPLSNGAGDVYVTSPVSTAPAGSFLVYNQSQQVRAGTAALPIVVRILDASGMPVSGAPITFASADNTITFSNASTVTSSQGYAIAYPSTPTVNGPYSVTIASGAATTTYNLTVTGGSTPGGGNGGGTAPGTLGGLFLYSGNGQVTYSNSLLLTPLVVQLRDDQGKPIAGVPVTFTLNATDANSGFLTPAAITGEIYSVTCNGTTTCTGVTDSTGKLGVAYFSGFVFPGNGSQQITVTASTASATNTFTITALSLDNSVGVSDLTPNQGSTITVPAGGTLPNAIKATLVARGPNGFGPIANVAVTASTPNSDPATGVTASCGGNNLSDQNGIATCNLVAGPVLGTSPLSFVVANREFFFNIRVVPGTPSKINLTTGATLSGAPGANLGQISGTVVDANGNPLAGVAVSFQVSNPAGVVLSSVSTVSGPDGRVAAAVSAGTAPGVHTVTIRAGNATATSTITVTVPFATLQISSGNNQSAVNGTAFTSPIAVITRDASGNPVANQIVTFAVTSGPATLSSTSALTNAQGIASVNVTAGATTGPIVVTASAGNQSTTFNLTSRLPGPAFTIANLVNGAGFTQQPYVVPGQILTITGAGFAPNLNGVAVPPAGSATLPTQLSGVSVTFNGISAPIFNVVNLNGAEQVTVQVPFELQPNTTTSITINAQGGGSTTLNNVPVQQYGPGLFTTTYGSSTVRYGVAIHNDTGAYVTPDNPARRGETLKVFVAGLGQTTPATGTNVAGTGGQSTVGNVVIGLNYAGVRVISTEYVRGSVGVYLVTFQVPTDAPIGPQIVLNLGIASTGATQNVLSNETRIPIAQ